MCVCVFATSATMCLSFSLSSHFSLFTLTLISLHAFRMRCCDGYVGTMDALLCEQGDKWEVDDHLYEEAHKMCSEVSRCVLCLQ